MGDRKWKQEVLERDCHTCKICGSHNQLTVHHKVAKCKGGAGVPENTVCWCAICHRAYHKKWGLTQSDDYGNPLQNHYTKPTQKKTRKPHRHCKHSKKIRYQNYHR